MKQENDQEMLQLVSHMLKEPLVLWHARKLCFLSIANKEVIMNILGGIKDRILHRNEEDIGDFREHILGQEQYQPPGPEPPKKLYEREPAAGDAEPFGFDKGLEEPMGFRKPAETLEVSKNYEIMDRLNMIDAQLSAIRSQTETINERLKNLEMRLAGRRY